ncbi:hypothetical protein JW887_01775 [Candidatus Dojkabacteria bacterium]|nr:hypothetical protein [Candidatus Dojkabacteria bacterium]
MIEHIFVSKVRVKILKLFFLDASREIHIRGIVRKISEEINAVRRELKNLQLSMILTSNRRGNRMYYKINTDCPIYYELSGMIHKEFGLGGKVLENRDGLGDIKYVVLTTAYIEDHHPSPYDIDILFVGNINLKGVATTIKSAEKIVNREIRYTVMTTEEFEFRKKKRDSFVENIVNKHKIMVIGDENQFMT